MAQATNQTTNAAELNELTFELQKEGLKRQERSHLLRGHAARVKAAENWADGQEVRAERKGVEKETEEVKLEISKVKLEISRDNLKGTQAERQLNQVGWVRKLSKKAYAVSGDTKFLQAAISAGAAVSSVALPSFGNSGSGNPVNISNQ